MGGACSANHAISKGMPSDSEIRALTRETGFTSNEVKEWFILFKEDYPSGTATLQDFLQAVLPPDCDDPNSKIFAERLFHLANASKSGRLSFSEYLNILATIQHGVHKSKIDLVFDMFDLNQNGLVTTTDIRNVLANHPTFRGKSSPEEEVELDRFLRQLDRDSDGKVTKDEFMTIHSRHPEAVEAVRGAKVVDVQLDKFRDATMLKELPRPAF
eukprot:NODE_395_length_1549_cov_112.062588_g363_i0.p1 GENE.NODE_395_length_1549_cov_112.062588_g363_i0~~NODE_395_length_1549_cov_112.062588_g363_i0.p1  ORF type:complete len:214 (-),score=26.30 NODE_395_length_1549_cov_112.062588_g363_i0:747-1388(-)